MVDQNGLEWVQELFGLEPRWTRDPDIAIIERIVRRYVAHDEKDQVEVIFHAQGAFNKLYKVTSAGLNYIMRVSLPVDPHYKTESEVATIKFVRKETDIPVPGIIAFDSNNQNELGFEWILMEKMPGSTLRKKWRKMSWGAKEELTRRLARYQSQLFDKRFERIGNIFAMRSAAEQNANLHEQSFEVRRLVSLIFFWGDHLTHDVDRGPFKTSHEWLRTRLQFVLTDQQSVLETSDDQDDIETAEFAKNLAEKLVKALPTVFSPDANATESTILFHDDLSMQNIMVDSDGTLTAIVDWECVSAVPLWSACQLPEFLEGPSRDDEPRREDYMADSDDEMEGEKSQDALENEGICDLYWEHFWSTSRPNFERSFWPRWNH